METRPIRKEEIEVIRAALEQAGVRSVDETAVSSIPTLTVVERCECGCASVDFEARPSEHPWELLGDGVGVTPRGGKVGVIVWGRQDAITGLEIYDMNAGHGDLVLPIPKSIVPLPTSGAG